MDETLYGVSMIVKAYKPRKGKSAVQVIVRGKSYYEPPQRENYPSLATYWSTRLGLPPFHDAQPVEEQ